MYIVTGQLIRNRERIVLVATENPDIASDVMSGWDVDSTDGGIIQGSIRLNRSTKDTSGKCLTCGETWHMGWLGNDCMLLKRCEHDVFEYPAEVGDTDNDPVRDGWVGKDGRP